MTREVVLDLFQLVGRDELAVVTPERSVTYEELDAESIEVAGTLAGLGVRKGTVVALVAPNGQQWTAWWLACARLGAVVVPMNTFSRPAEVLETLHHCGAHVLVAVPEFRRQEYRCEMESSLGRPLDHTGNLRCPQLPQLRHVIWIDRLDEVRSAVIPADREFLDSLSADVDPADPLTIVYTSGSTGAPKGIVHSHGAVVRQAQRLAEMVRPDRRPVLWTSMPLNWVGGLMWSFLRVVASGGTLVTQEVFEPGDAIQLIRQAKVNVITANSPVVAERLQSHPSYAAEDFVGIDGMILPVASESPPPSALGMTETLGPHSGWSRMDAYPPEAAGSLGRAMPGTEHRVIDPDTGLDVPDGAPGELLVRGDSLMLGRMRLERHQAVTADGWYRTGDEVVRRDGWIFLNGRLDDVIKTSGANVSPAEVASVLMQHDAVAMAVVTSRPHPVRGADVVGFIVPTSGSGLDTGDVLDHARSRLAGYKVPRTLHVLQAADVPWTPSQKVDRRKLSELAIALDP